MFTLDRALDKASCVSMYHAILQTFYFKAMNKATVRKHCKNEKNNVCFRLALLHGLGSNIAQWREAMDFV